ncbi:MAG: TonB-dependent receptor plug domain-containing protein [Pseudomonas sp.]
MAIPLSAWADQPPTADDQDALALPDSTWNTRESPYKVDHASSAKYSEPLRDTPQSVTVLSETLLKEQNAQSLKDALRNVPGITFNSGEGGGGVGDSLTIRGFNADGNIYRDGVRDPAKYSRDDFFNTEGVEVFKGSSTAAWGVGAVGGAVNLVTKTRSWTTSTCSAAASARPTSSAAHWTSTTASTGSAKVRRSAST